MSQDKPYKRSCRCGNKTLQFKNDIGPFFIEDCCLAKGYDHLGLKAGEKPEAPVKSEAEIKSLSPSEVLDKRKAEKELLKAERAAEISKRQAEREARAAEKAARALKIQAEQEAGSDETPA